MAIRKILLLQLIYLSSILCCNAGTGGSFTIGADAGLGLSGLYGSTAFFSNFPRVELSESAGINFWFNFPKIVSIGSGIYYCQFGLSDSSIYNTQFREAWNTINIPLLARVSFGKKVIFFAEAGPFLSIDLNRPYLLTGWVELPLALIDGAPEWYSTKTINAGITAGSGIEVTLPHRFALSFEVRGNIGLTNITNIISGWSYGNGVKTYRCALLCGFSYTFPVSACKQKTPGRR